MRCFVKAGRVHTHPKGTKCTVNYDGEVLCEEPPVEVEKCPFCFLMQQSSGRGNHLNRV